MTLGTLVQLPYFLPPVTATLDHVQPVQEEEEPHVTTTCGGDVSYQTAEE